MIRNAHKTSVKVFLVPYDFKDMPINSKTFIRQKSYVGFSEGEERMRYAIHVSFVNSGKNQLFLASGVRVVFVSRKESVGILRTVTNGPENPKFSPISLVNYSASCSTAPSNWADDNNLKLEKGR